MSFFRSIVFGQKSKFVASFFPALLVSSNKENKNRSVFGRPLRALSVPFLGSLSGGTDIPSKLIEERSKVHPPPDGADKDRYLTLTRFGLPGNEFDEIVRFYRQFVIEYDPQKRTARWVLEHLTRDSVKSPERKLPAHSHWQVDSNYHFAHRPVEAEWKAYSETEGDLKRFQLASPKNYNDNENGFLDTYYTSNTVLIPKETEAMIQVVNSYVRELAQTAKNTWVVTGPLFHHPNGEKRANWRVFGTKEWGSHSVACPVAFFKVVLTEIDDDSLHLHSFIVPCDERYDCDICDPDSVVPCATTFMKPWARVKELAAIDDFPLVPLSDIATINNVTNAVWSGKDCRVPEAEKRACPAPCPIAMPCN